MGHVAVDFTGAASFLLNTRREPEPSLPESDIEVETARYFEHHDHTVIAGAGQGSRKLARELLQDNG